MKQASTTAQADVLPALPHIVVPPSGEPYLAGKRCSACGIVIEGDRLACPACGGRGTLAAQPLSAAGTVHTYTVVHRSYPGVPTPFIAVVVDLDGGGTVRGTLTGVDPTLRFSGARVRMAFGDSEQRAADGRPFLIYVFELERGPQA